MTWDEMAIDMLHAAKATRLSHPRCCASRAYYAAHVALAKALIKKGYKPSPGATTQGHKMQPKLIDQFLGEMGLKKRRDLKRILARLYRRRLDSDYVPEATVDAGIALESVRDAGAVFVTLGMPEVA